MPKKNVPKQQHWVPKFYLKEFAIPDTRTQKTPKICIVDKTWKIPEPRAMSIATVCTKKHLYTPLDEAGDRDIGLEEDFSKLESKASDYWDDFAGGRFGLANDKQKAQVAHFLAALHLRNKRVSDLISSLMKNRDQLLGGPITKNADGTKRITRPFEKTPDPTDPGRYFAQSTRAGIKRVADCFQSYEWAIFHTGGDCLLTSDIPITFFDYEGRRSGIGKKDAHAIFPISPNSILFMKNSGGGASQPVRLTDVEIIALFNRMTWLNAERFVMLNKKPDA